MLNKIKFSYREADEQKNLFTPYHTLFKCKIKIDGLQYTFNYQCNTAVAEPNLIDCMYAIISDMDCYDAAKDMSDFNYEFGYIDDKAYKACKKTSKALHRLFTDEEIGEITRELEEEEGF